MAIDLGTYVKLGKRVGIYVPSNVRGKVIDNKPIVKGLAEDLSKLFGGATAQNAQGFWVGGQGLVAEDVTIIWSNVSEDALAEAAGVIVTKAEALKKELEQEAVAVEIDGTLYLV